MSNIGERVKTLRKETGLSQTEFGERWGVGLGVIRNIETSKTVPSNAQIDLICRVFQVNRVWLETGEGEMFPDTSREEKLWKLVNDALDDEPDSFRRRVVEVLAELDADGWRKLREAAEVLQALGAEKKKEEE